MHCEWWIRKDTNSQLVISWSYDFKVSEVLKRNPQGSKRLQLKPEIEAATSVVILSICKSRAPREKELLMRYRWSCIPQGMTQHQTIEGKLADNDFWHCFWKTLWRHLHWFYYYQKFNLTREKCPPPRITCGLQNFHSPPRNGRQRQAFAESEGITKLHSKLGKKWKTNWLLKMLCMYQRKLLVWYQWNVPLWSNLGKTPLFCHRWNWFFLWRGLSRRVAYMKWMVEWKGYISKTILI